MLALSPSVVYVQEPFNSNYFNPGACSARFTHRFTYVTCENESAWRAAFERTTQLRYKFKIALRAVRSRTGLHRVLSEAVKFSRHRRLGSRALLKDPLAVLSAAWLAERFDAAVVVLIRHPLAFVGSVKRLGWGSPVAGLLAQPLLIRDYLQPLLREAQRYTAHDTDRVDQAAMLWKIIYTVVDCYRDRHPSWYFVRHEDLSTNPIAEFARLYTQLNLQFDAAIARTIDDYTGSHNPPDTPERNTVVRVDSRANLNTWQRRLSRDEVARVRHITASVAERFYGSDEW